MWVLFIQLWAVFTVEMGIRPTGFILNHIVVIVIGENGNEVLESKDISRTYTAVDSPCCRTHRFQSWQSTNNPQDFRST
ncbi:hypothetical protein B0H17DRAFT_1212987 [Mycena rosella]|uniref:Secreted protein n=1 Tax=Mycena rosella TaxID=1033263 RepID=A0AAD7CRZ5_MYCRO|nr:hypothetical protein B0H17DRAFT_1212987 [Mycena rosella]